MKKIKKSSLLLAVCLLLAILRGVFWFAFEYEAEAQPPTSHPPVPVAPPKNIPAENNAQGCITGSFSLKVRLPLNEITVVRYAVPVVPGTKKPRGSAANIVFYAPFNGEAQYTRTRGLKPWALQLAEECGFTVFSCTIEANTLITDDPKQYYIYKESGWFDVIFAVKRRLEQDFQLPERPLLIMGESSGGSMAQQMAAAFPERIRAAAWSGGSRYVPAGKKFPPFLALNTWGCYGEKNTRSWAEQTIAKGHDGLYASAPPNQVGTRQEHHAAGRLSRRLIQCFLAEAAGKGSAPEPFAGLYAALPHEVISQFRNPEQSGYAVYPHKKNPKAIVLIFGVTENALQVRGLDAMEAWMQKNMIPVSFRLPDVSAHEQVAWNRKMISEMVNHPSRKHLPVFVAGAGSDGQLGAVAALQEIQARLKGVYLYGAEYNVPIPAFSVAEHHKNKAIPVKVYGPGDDWDQLVRDAENP